jgi:hypothetical protein
MPRAIVTDADTSPKYNVVVVEAVILEMAAELHPMLLAPHDLSLRVVSDPDDKREVETVAEAIRGLREFGLLSKEEEIVEPTLAALRAVVLLA